MSHVNRTERESERETERERERERARKDIILFVMEECSVYLPT
jgi:hypothetical protein